MVHVVKFLGRLRSRTSRSFNVIVDVNCQGRGRQGHCRGFQVKDIQVILRSCQGFLVRTKIKDVKDRGSEVQNKFAFKYIFFPQSMKKFTPESLNDEYYRARNQSSVFV